MLYTRLSTPIMMIVAFAVTILAISTTMSSSSFVVDAFSPTPRMKNTLPRGATLPMASTFRPLYAGSSSTDGSASISSGLQMGDPVMLVGPGLFQLVLARHLARAGLRPIVVAQQTKLNSFFENLLKTDPQWDVDGVNEQIKSDSTIGMPEVGDPYFGELKGVVFCAEEAVLPPDFVSRVLDFSDQGQSAFADGRPSRVICALPVSNKVQKEKSNSWIPIFNNDKTMDDNWKRFYDTFVAHPSYREHGTASIVRFGSLFGGSIDGPPELRDLGLDEGMYKMSLEQYRDMRERAFDRYKLGGQVLKGDSINMKPLKQDSMEKDALKKYSNEIREAFPILGDYPEIDRTNRHTFASAIVQALLNNDCPKEMTILSKARSELPTPEMWNEMFANPQAASWPDPNKFQPEKYGMLVGTSK